MSPEKAAADKAAAQEIQASIDGHAARTEVAALEKVAAVEEAAAQQVQASIDGHNARIDVMAEAAAADEAAAQNIQASIDGHTARAEVAASVARKPGRILIRLPDARIECSRVQAPRESGKCPMSLLLIFRNSRNWQQPMLGGRI